MQRVNNLKRGGKKRMDEKKKVVNSKDSKNIKKQNAPIELEKHPKSKEEEDFDKELSK